MTKRSLLILFLIVALFLIIQTVFAQFLASSIWLNQLFSMFYVWSPGLIGLYFARKEGIALPIFSKLNKWFYLIPLIALLVGGFGLLASILFNGAQTVNPEFSSGSIGWIIGNTLLFLFIGFGFILILLCFIFLGGELYWRGYFWEKVKSRRPLNMIFLTALIWSLWQLPPSLYFNRLNGIPLGISFLGVFVLNFVLSPVLTFFRLKTKSIFGAAYAYSALIASFIFFLILFPTTDLRIVATTGGFFLLGLILFSLVFKLYQPSTWKKLV